MIRLYTDGSYRDDCCGWAYIIVAEDDHIIAKENGNILIDPSYMSMHNIAGELEAVMNGLQTCREIGFSIVEVCYDYLGVEKWATGEWKAGKEGTKVYRDFMREISKDITVVFQKVKAHSGDLFNEMADQMAKEAIGIHEM